MAINNFFSTIKTQYVKYPHYQKRDGILYCDLFNIITQTLQHFTSLNKNTTYNFCYIHKGYTLVYSFSRATALFTLYFFYLLVFIFEIQIHTLLYRLQYKTIRHALHTIYMELLQAYYVLWLLTTFIFTIVILCFFFSHACANFSYLFSSLDI